MVRRMLQGVTTRNVLKSRRVRDYAFMTIGILITAFGLDAFLIPNKLAAGGVSGLSTVLHYTLLDRGFNIPVGLMMLAMNAVLLVVAVSMKGWRYGARTIYGMVGLSLAVDLMAPFVPHLAANDPLLAVLYGGAITGIGMGLVFKARANTGGTDIVAQLLADRTNFSVGQGMLAADAVVTLAAALAFGPDLALYGAVSIVVMGRVIDLVQEGLSVEKAAYIISEHSDRIAEAILVDLGRGATGLTGRGLYSGSAREIIFTVVSRKEIDALKALVHAADPGAFMIISDIHEALGEGFKAIGD
ncbi:MAG: YitT family protein [Actinomycetota bacterium]|nr:YitT family protein [Actinomycetota bacterium]